MTDLILAIGHHLLAFGLAAILAGELVLARPGIAGAALNRLQRLDRLYGALAGTLVIVGVLRVIYGFKGPDFYLPNPSFWAKMAAFLLVALLSIPPTLRIAGWSRRAKADPDFIPPDAEVASLRTWLGRELAFFALIPIFAAMMARGIGL
jgi:putative membrane protein